MDTLFRSRKVYVRGKIELKLSLLCLTANQEEKRLASFDAILEGHNTNESVDDVLLVELKQPYIFIHSNAIDRAVLVYLNYRTGKRVTKCHFCGLTSNKGTLFNILSESKCNEGQSLSLYYFE